MEGTVFLLRKNVDDLYELMKKFVLLPYEKRREIGCLGRTHMEMNFYKK